MHSDVELGPEFGRVLLIMGIVLLVVGRLAVLGVQLPFGRLPGDIAISGARRKSAAQRVDGGVGCAAASVPYMMSGARVPRSGG